MEILMNCVVSVLQMLVFTVYLKELLGFRRPIYWMVCGWLGLELVSRGLAWIFNNVAVNALSFLLLLAASFCCKKQHSPFLHVKQRCAFLVRSRRLASLFVRTRRSRATPTLRGLTASGTPPLVSQPESCKDDPFSRPRCLSTTDRACGES